MAKGHSGSEERGKDIICSAVSVLFRSFSKAVYASSSIESSGSASKRGNLRLEISSIPDDRVEWLRGMSTLILTGLLDLEREFPGNIHVDVKRKIE